MEKEPTNKIFSKQIGRINASIEKITQHIDDNSKQTEKYLDCSTKDELNHLSQRIDKLYSYIGRLSKK